MYQNPPGSGVDKRRYKKGDIITTAYFINGVCYKVQILHRGRINGANLLAFLEPYKKGGKFSPPTRKTRYNGGNRSLKVTLSRSSLTLEHVKFKAKIQADVVKNDPLKGF
ncbi:unnamed protein product [marine sediment metagenome]|uniref:Uncharacterized protein n=1 Tax=marine sediment metagenome TaxID=412755 RepID=X0TLJ6_9ZZZZ